MQIYKSEKSPFNIFIVNTPPKKQRYLKAKDPIYFRKRRQKAFGGPNSF